MSELAKHRTRLAIARAVTLEINCPHCGEPQPAANGSHLWTVDEARKASLGTGRRNCAACGEIMIFDIGMDGTGKVQLV